MLDRLEALAREAADEAEGDWFCDDLLEPPYPLISSSVKARHFMAHASPAAVLKLIAVVKAARQSLSALDSAALYDVSECSDASEALRLALAELERE